MKKFAFLIHLGSSYRKDLQALARPLGWIPDAVYQFALRHRPLSSFVWSDVTLTPEATEPDGHIIMLPYTTRQLIEQQTAMLPRINEALSLAASKGAEIVGLGGLTSLIAQDGKRLAENPYVSVTNGNVYTAVIICQRISQLICECHNPKPVVALVGATGCLGTLVSTLLAKNHVEAQYLLIGRNSHRLHRLASDLRTLTPSVQATVSQQPDECKRADIVVMLTSTADYFLQAHQLKVGAVVLDNAYLHTTQSALLTKRPDVTVIDGGLIAAPHVYFQQRSISLPNGIACARLAETILLAKAHYPTDFGVGNETAVQAAYISTLAHRFSHLGFGIAPDHSFGKPIFRRAIVAREARPVAQPRFTPTTTPSYEKLS